MAALRERVMPSRTVSHPVLPRIVRKQTKQLVRQQASLDSLLDYTPEHVVIETRDAAGESVSWKVFVTEVSGVSTLDLYHDRSEDSLLGKRPPLTHLTKEVCGLVQLQRLWASHNLFTSLPPTLPDLIHLRDLLLHQNKFTEFPTVICQLPNLQMLWLSHNQITNIPEEISNLSSLRRLHLDNNDITELPDAICNLTQLEVLYLNHNSIEKVSDSIGRLQSLKHLLLQYNDIHELPRSIVDLDTIERLNLGHNQLKSLSKEFRSFQSEKNSDGKLVSTSGNPLDKPLIRMRSVDHTSPVLRPRTMSFPLSAGYHRRKSDSVSSPSPSPSPSHPYPRRQRFVHSQSEDQS